MNNRAFIFCSFVFMAANGGLVSRAEAGLLFGPDTYHECLLDRLQGVEDDQAAIQEANACLAEFPEMRLPEKKTPFLFGPDTSRECAEKWARDHRSSIAAEMIYAACFVVYPAEQTPDTTDE